MNMNCTIRAYSGKNNKKNNNEHKNKQMAILSQWFLNQKNNGKIF